MLTRGESIQPTSGHSPHTPRLVRGRTTRVDVRVIAGVRGPRALTRAVLRARDTGRDAGAVWKRARLAEARLGKGPRRAAVARSDPGQGGSLPRARQKPTGGRVHGLASACPGPICFALLRALLPG